MVQAFIGGSPARPFPKYPYHPKGGQAGIPSNPVPKKEGVRCPEENPMWEGEYLEPTPLPRAHCADPSLRLHPPGMKALQNVIFKEDGSRTEQNFLRANHTDKVDPAPTAPLSTEPIAPTPHHAGTPSRTSRNESWEKTLSLGKLLLRCYSPWFRGIETKKRLAKRKRRL